MFLFSILLLLFTFICKELRMECVSCARSRSSYCRMLCVNMCCVVYRVYIQYIFDYQLICAVWFVCAVPCRDSTRSLKPALSLGLYSFIYLLSLHCIHTNTHSHCSLVDTFNTQIESVLIILRLECCLFGNLMRPKFMRHTEWERERKKLTQSTVFYMEREAKTF